ASLFPLSSSAGGVPPACIGSEVKATCSGATMIQTLGFGLPASGDPPLCSSAPTTVVPVCGLPPADGFTLQRGQLSVFIDNQGLATSGFTDAAAGFGVDTAPGFICPANRVLTADAQGPSAPPVELPSPTPSSTPTPTATLTFTPTSTPTYTPTP